MFPFLFIILITPASPSLLNEFAFVSEKPDAKLCLKDYLKEN